MNDIAAVLDGEDEWCVVQGNAMDVLRTMPENSVHCVVTSPPYWGLRSYDACECVTRDHPGDEQTADPDCQWCGGTGKSPEFNVVWDGDPEWYGQLGLEPTPELYVQHLVQIFREVRRVLRDDGVAWVVIGDSYNNRSISRKSSHQTGLGFDSSDLRKSWADLTKEGRTRLSLTMGGMKEKDLVMIPAHLALALRADGWWVRSGVIWHKTATMPESVRGWRWEPHRVKVKASERGKEDHQRGAYATPQGDHVDGQIDGSATWEDCHGCETCEPNDGLVLRKGSWRPTSSHEFVFMLANGEKYFGDGDAVRESFVDDRMGNPGPYKWKYAEMKPGGLSKGQGWTRGAELGGRNKRDVWTINPRGTKMKHYAIFPEALVEPCILSSTSEKGMCSECGEPWARVVERLPAPHDGSTESLYPEGSAGHRISLARQAQRERGHEPVFGTKTLGFRPTCSHDAPAVPCVVLDPFAGTGTTGLVALHHKRRFVGIEIGNRYVQMARDRIANDKVVFAREHHVNVVEALFGGGEEE